MGDYDCYDYGEYIEGLEQLLAEREELKAQAAVMRKLLQDVVNDLKRPEQGELPPWKLDLLARAQQALSASAGKELLEKVRELDALVGRLGTMLLEVRECINIAYLQVDQYTMPQTAVPNKVLLEQALKDLWKAVQILDKAYKEVSDNA